jgi:hypothetical protein
MMQNGYGEGLRNLARAAFASIRASLAGAELPPSITFPAATHIPKAADYAGTYTGEDGRVFTLEAERDGLRLDAGPVTVMLEQEPLSVEPSDAFLVPHDALERFPLVFKRDAAGTVVEAFHGDTWFRSDRYTGPEPPSAPDEWRRYVGFYRNNDPWAPTLRVFIRKGVLAIEWPASATDDADENELVPLADGWFAVGSEREPGRIRFLGEGAGGKAVVAEYNSGNWFRSFEE